MDTFSVLNPEHIAPVRNLTLRAKMIVEGTIAGLHKSPFHGFSAEFLEYRPYLSGEPARKIDWRKFAKSDKCFVRLYEDETNLSAHILLDKSASMGFRGQGAGDRGQVKDKSQKRRLAGGFSVPLSPISLSPVMSKFDYARTLAASFAWILVRQKDAVGLAAFDEELRGYLSPKSTNLQLKNILSYLESASAERQTRCGDVINSAAAMMKKRGLCIVISDFFDDPESVAMGLRHLRFKRQDILAVAVADPMELNFGGKSDYRLRDMETGREITIDSRTASEYFNKGFAEHHAALDKICRELKIDFEVVTTVDPFHKSLMWVIEKRRRLY